MGILEASLGFSLVEEFLDSGLSVWYYVTDNYVCLFKYDEVSNSLFRIHDLMSPMSCLFWK